MEPPIQYAKTSDGVSIAFWAIGDGPALVFLPPMPGHIQLEWRTRYTGDNYRRLARRYQVIRLDARGSGLSQRTVADITLEARLLDLDAVADKLGIDQLTLYALGPSGIFAIAYAAKRPERVAALILSECFPSFVSLADVSQAQALTSLLRKDFETFTETMGGIFFGWQAGDLAREFAAVLRESVTADQMQAFNDAFMSVDVSEMLPQIRAKTLVFHHRRATLVPMEVIANLAARIPEARLVVREGDTVAGTPGDPEGDSAIDEFLLGEAWQAPGPPRPPTAANVAVILFADIADSTALTERLGDAAFREKARELDKALGRAITSNGGAAIEGKLLGDGVLATFGAAREAIACAQAIHEMAGSGVQGQGSSPNDALLLHVGIHAGDVIRELNPDGRSNVYGGAVNIAARVAGGAAAGETLVSGTVRDLARTSAGVTFEDRGERELKGVSDPVRVFSVRWRD